MVLIEKETETANAAGNELDCMVINDDGSRPEAQRRAGVARADWFLALTGSDEVNIVSCGLVAAESSRIRTVARVESAFYSSLSEAQRRSFGLDVLIDPARETAESISHIIAEGFAGAISPLHDGRLQLRYIQDTEGLGFAGKSLMELRQERSQSFLVAAVLRDSKLSIPDGNFIIQATDGIYVLGTPEDLDQVLGSVANIHQTAKRILVIGVSKTAERLIESLAANRPKANGLAKMLRNLFRGKRQIMVLDDSRDQVKRLARQYQNAEFVQGDCTDEGVLEGIGIDKTDLVVCATESQTRNILVARLAKALGAKKTIAITTNDRFKPLTAVLDVDAMVSMKTVVAAAILELIRHGRIRTIYEFFEDDIEIVELPLTEQSSAVGSSLRDLTMPRGSLVAFIIKDREVFIPDGNTVLAAGDSMAIIVEKKALGGLERLFGSTSLGGERHGG